jgi:hypothetical protein
MSETKLDIILNFFTKTEDEKPKCTICDSVLPLTRDNQINKNTCWGFEGDYWHKICKNKEKIRMDK